MAELVECGRCRRRVSNEALQTIAGLAVCPDCVRFQEPLAQAQREEMKARAQAAAVAGMEAGRKGISAAWRFAVPASKAVWRVVWPAVKTAARRAWVAVRFMAPCAGKALWWLTVGLVKMIGGILVGLGAVLAWLWRHRPRLSIGGGGGRPATKRQKDYLAALEDKPASSFDDLSVEEASKRISRHTGT